MNVILDDAWPFHKLSYEEALAFDPGTFLQAQDGTVFLVVRENSGYGLEPRTTRLVGFRHHAFLLKNERQGYCHFREMGKLDIHLRTPPPEEAET